MGRSSGTPHKEWTFFPSLLTNMSNTSAVGSAVACAYALQEEIPEEAHGSKDAVPGAASSSSAAAAAAAGLHTQGGGAVVRRSNHRHTGSFKGDASLEEEQMTDGQVEQLRLQLEEQMQTVSGEEETALCTQETKRNSSEHQDGTPGAKLFLVHFNLNS